VRERAAQSLSKGAGDGKKIYLELVAKLKVAKAENE
jgi:hypothetical protein